MAGAFSYIDNLMSEASLHQGQDQKIKDMMNPTAQENSRQSNQVTRESSIWAWSFSFNCHLGAIAATMKWGGAGEGGLGRGTADGGRGGDGRGGSEGEGV